MVLPVFFILLTMLTNETKNYENCVKNLENMSIKCIEYRVTYGKSTEMDRQTEAYKRRAL